MKKLDSEDAAILLFAALWSGTVSPEQASEELGHIVRCVLSSNIERCAERDCTEAQFSRRFVRAMREARRAFNALQAMPEEYRTANVQRGQELAQRLGYHWLFEV